MVFNKYTIGGSQMQISNTGLDLIKSFEGFIGHMYLCPAGVPTIGYGTTLIEGKPIAPGTVITEDKASELLRQQIDATFAPAVIRHVKVPLNQNQFDALVSWTYNLGEGSLASSTMLKLLNQGDYASVPAQMMRWTKANGVDLPGLVRRRQAEAELFARPQA
jgi:lysozyme